MATSNQVREVHKILDDWIRNKGLYADEVQMVRSLLPELPKQKTLAEVIAHVDNAWAGASDNDWGGNSYGSEISIEDWLAELRGQLEGLAEESAKDPVLPAGMRLAAHKEFGRVVATGWVDYDGEHFCVYRSDELGRGSYVFLPEDSLTFIDSKPAHPEFLETEEAYYAAPSGTVVATPGRLPWVKEGGGDWSCSGGYNSDNAMAKSGQRKVLRWGWGNGR